MHYPPRSHPPAAVLNVSFTLKGPGPSALHLHRPVMELRSQACEPRAARLLGRSDNRECSVVIPKLQVPAQSHVSNTSLEHRRFIRTDASGDCRGTACAQGRGSGLADPGAKALRGWRGHHTWWPGAVWHRAP